MPTYFNMESPVDEALLRVSTVPPAVNEAPDWHYTADIFFNELVGDDARKIKDVANYMAEKLAMKLIDIYINTPDSLEKSEDPLSSPSLSGGVLWMNLLQGFTSCIPQSDLSRQTLKLLKLLGLLQTLRKCSVAEHDIEVFCNMVQLSACLKKFPDLQKDSKQQQLLQELQEKVQRQGRKCLNNGTDSTSRRSTGVEAHPWSEFHERIKLLVKSQITDKSDFKEQEKKETTTSEHDVAPTVKTEPAPLSSEEAGPSLSANHLLPPTVPPITEQEGATVKVEEKQLQVVLSSTQGVESTRGSVKQEETTFGNLGEKEIRCASISKMFDKENGEDSPMDYLPWSSDESVDIEPFHLQVTGVASMSRGTRAVSHESDSAGPSSKKRRVEWSTDEIEYLKKGVEKMGVGKWKKILQMYPFNGRSNVDLKDKWRNLHGPRSKNM